MGEGQEFKPAMISSRGGTGSCGLCKHQECEMLALAVVVEGRDGEKLLH